MKWKAKHQLGTTCSKVSKARAKERLKRYIARSQNIPAKSDDEYADSEDDKGIPGHSSGVLIPGHTSSSDETIETELGKNSWAYKWW